MSQIKNCCYLSLNCICINVGIVLTLCRRSLVVTFSSRVVVLILLKIRHSVSQSLVKELNLYNCNIKQLLLVKVENVAATKAAIRERN